MVLGHMACNHLAMAARMFCCEFFNQVLPFHCFVLSMLLKSFGLTISVDSYLLVTL
jgi:hypothetical protein